MFDHAAGVPGSWEELKVCATLDLLQERDSRPPGGRTYAVTPTQCAS